jgi:CheY-like chemotaxis protein
LAAAQASPVTAGSDDGSLDRIIARELAPHDAIRVAVKGDPVSLTASAATIVTLVLHEIVTNSAKYGALHADGGTVAMSWQVEDGNLRIEWTERIPNANLRAPASRGFGSSLIEEAIVHQLEGRTSMEFRPSGVAIVLEIPTQHVTSATESPAKSEQPLPGRAPETSLALPEVLVLDDDYLVSSEHRALLLGAGVGRVTIAGTNAEAITRVKGSKPSAALVDLDLGREDSRETVKFLHDLNVPCVFLTGHVARHDWVSDYPDAPVLRKPLSAERLVSVLREVSGAGN